MKKKESKVSSCVEEKTKEGGGLKEEGRRMESRLTSERSEGNVGDLVNHSERRRVELIE